MVTQAGTQYIRTKGTENTPNGDTSGYTIHRDKGTENTPNGDTSGYTIHRDKGHREHTHLLTQHNSEMYKVLRHKAVERRGK